jgi:hypothetical protein
MQRQQHGSDAERLPLRLFQASERPFRDDRIGFARADCGISNTAVSNSICGICQNRTRARGFTILSQQ